MHVHIAHLSVKFTCNSQSVCSKLPLIQISNESLDSFRGMIQGIYTSDSLDKSMNYVGYGSGITGFVLLCEVRFL